MIPEIVAVEITRGGAGVWSARLEYSDGTYGKRLGPYKSLWEVAQIVAVQGPTERNMRGAK